MPSISRSYPKWIQRREQREASQAANRHLAMTLSNQLVAQGEWRDVWHRLNFSLMIAEVLQAYAEGDFELTLRFMDAARDRSRGEGK